MQAASNRPLRIAAFDLRISLSFPVKRSCLILVQTARLRYCEYPQCYWWDIAVPIRACCLSTYAGPIMCVCLVVSWTSVRSTPLEKLRSSRRPGSRSPQSDQPAGATTRIC